MASLDSGSIYLAENYHSSDVWYEHPRYQRYWHHYRDVWQWFHVHQNFCCPDASDIQFNMKEAYANYWKQYHEYLQHYTHWLNCLYFQQTGPFHDVHHPVNYEHFQTFYNSARSEQRYRIKPVEFPTDSESYLNSDFAVSDQDELSLEMEITEDMKKFFEISEKHRKEREMEKKLIAQESQDKYILAEDVSSLHIRGTTKAPVEQLGAKRIVEMKELYGTGAAMIHGMETSLQLTFDRNCDRKQPKLWPSIPINL